MIGRSHAAAEGVRAETARADLASLSPQKRAQVIFAEAQSQLSNRLWRAALGDGENKTNDGSPFNKNGMAMDSMLQLFGSQDTGAVGQAGCHCHCMCACCAPRHGHNPGDANAEEQGRRGGNRKDADDERDSIAAAVAPAVAFLSAPTSAVTGSGLQLGANARYTSAFAAAAERTGLPASAIAAIVDAEAAKGSDGSWNTLSRNPRSSAAGLGQFLSGTWQNLAETKGSWLNAVATERGWLDGRGRVTSSARGELLALRYDPQASIASVADLAKNNLEKLEQGGLRVRNDAETLAKAAYLGHHLGLGDAKKFLAGGIESGRARMLLAAQIGSGAAEQRIASAGNATQAHREWLLRFIERRIQPEKFAA